MHVGIFIVSLCRAELFGKHMDGHQRLSQHLRHGSAHHITSLGTGLPMRKGFKLGLLGELALDIVKKFYCDNAGDSLHPPQPLNGSGWFWVVAVTRECGV